MTVGEGGIWSCQGEYIKVNVRAPAGFNSLESGTECNIYSSSHQAAGAVRGAESTVVMLS